MILDLNNQVLAARWDRESFYHHATGPALADRTLFEGVFQVLPGHYLLATEHGVTLHRYWDFDFPTATELTAPGPDAEYVAEFRTVLEDAVRLRLRADVPVGCYLSGGLDSAAVLGLAALHAREPIHAFTLTFDHAAYDEGKLGEEMADRAGANFHPVPIRQSNLAQHFADAIWHAETWFINGHGIAKFLLSRAVREAGLRLQPWVLRMITAGRNSRSAALFVGDRRDGQKGEQLVQSGLNKSLVDRRRIR